MGNINVNLLPELLAVETSDVFHVIDDAVVTPVDKKITFSNLEASISHANLADLGTGVDHSYIDQDVTITGTPEFRSITVPNQQTASDSSYGIIYKDGTRFIHNFRHPTGDTDRPNGGNTFVGMEAGNLTMGSTATDTAHASYNVAMGYQALSSNTIGGSNTAYGFQALHSNTEGDYNTANGLQSLYSNTEGNQNTASGYRSLYSNTTGENNTASGYYALYSNTEGDKNTANGYYALNSNTTGERNTASGAHALQSNTTGVRNTANGYHALNSNTEGNYNTASGYQSLSSNTTGGHNTASGYYALNSNTEGSYNTATGMFSLSSNTTGSYNTANGYYALNSNTTGESNTVSGYKVLYSNTTGDYNTASGYQSLYDVTEGEYNTAIGYNTGRGITTGDYNTIIGAQVTGLAADLQNNIIIADGEGNQRIRVDSDGNMAVGHTDPDTVLDINGAFTFRELSSDPDDPDEGAAVLWMSDGTGSGSEGDILMKITAGGVTKTTTRVDFSAL